MESALTKLLMLIVSIAIAGSVIGLAWSLYSSISKTLDAEISDLQVFSTGNNFRIMFKLKNTGSLEITRISIEIYSGTNRIGSWSSSSSVPPGGERFYDSGFIKASLNSGDSIRILFTIYSSSRSIMRTMSTIVMRW